MVENILDKNPKKGCQENEHGGGISRSGTYHTTTT
jgi:hypothetical protein